SAMRSSSKPLCSISSSTKSIAAASLILAIPRVPNSITMWPTATPPSARRCRIRFGFKRFLLSPPARQLSLAPGTPQHLAVHHVFRRRALRDRENITASVEAIVAEDFLYPRHGMRRYDDILQFQ